MNIDKKEDLLKAFAAGEIKKLITKPKMTAFGLNWQHCNHTVYFPTWSYEQYYQSIRRFWRFGQKNEVIVDRIFSDGQNRVLEAIDLKTAKTNKLSHIIFQRYMSSVWMDIRSNNVLQFKDGREEDDEKHVHPLQLDVIDRLVELYSNPGEVVLTPFMGVGSEVYGAVSLNRKAIGIELKDTYFKQAVKNLKDVKKRFMKVEHKSLFDGLPQGE